MKFNALKFSHTPLKEILLHINSIVSFYVNGFRDMSKQGRTLWTIILIKLFIMFIVLKLFFFSNFLNSNYDNELDKSNHVINEITQQNE